ncbi:12823_t:CDS:2 [Cetraspora pellucida]|uniref:12823_t:CDS:1 n=1 Tax=Cetraspora pellucida TaxID=1433469 RepID=A0ACA9KK94_9GLOM|nr:12823_t:CDS:2 [Cetraspora pellucida]
MHNEDNECPILTTQLIYYKNQDYPFDFGYDLSKTPSLWWGVIEDDYLYLQDLARAIFAVVLSQASCEHNFSILRWLYDTYRTCLKELSESELHDSALSLTTYAVIENNGMVLEELEQNEDILKSTQSNHNLEISLIVDLSHVNFSE